MQYWKVFCIYVKYEITKQVMPLYTVINLENIVKTNFEWENTIAAYFYIPFKIILDRVSILIYGWGIIDFQKNVEMGKREV